MERDGSWFNPVVLLNWVEFALMNNAVRAAVQRRVEAARLLRLGGPMHGGRALEVGCGRGVGAALVLDRFGAGQVDAFDLDPRMVARARRRLAARGSRVHLWVGDAAAIAARNDTYDAVFDFGIIHHVPDWRAALREVHRVLKPGGTFYAEEVLAGLIDHPLTRRLVSHPAHDRFKADQFLGALEAARLQVVAQQAWRGAILWGVARKPARI